MATGIPTANILQPGQISVAGGANQALVSFLQLLTPQYYKEYVEKYGNEDFTWWLSTYGGMEQVYNKNFFWFENRGKLMQGIQTVGNVSAGVGATINLTLAAADHFNGGTQSPLRLGETLRVASTNVEGVILPPIVATPSAFTFNVAPKQTTQAFASAGSTSLLSGEVLLFGGIMDAGEASGPNNPLIHLDQKYQNNITEMRDTYSATDLAEMTQVYYRGVTGSAPVQQAGTSLFTYKELVKTDTRFKNYVEFKLLRGDIQNNTAIVNASGYSSSGSQGLYSKIATDGETVGYTAGTLDVPKLHEITRIMDVNGCAKQAMWMMDIYQRQDFSDGLFQTFPAGAFVWGQGEKSEDAQVSYGFQHVNIDGYMMGVKKYRPYNTEFTTGNTPGVDYFRNAGHIIPLGTAQDYKDATKVYKNLTIMFQQPPAGGTIGNGIRVWQHGGGSRNPSDGTMTDNVEFITYRSQRTVACNQFLFIEAA
jgi:hypothetical protein